MRLLVPAICLAFFSTSSVAQSNWKVNLGSYHTAQGKVIKGKKKDYNQFNPGVAYVSNNLEYGYYFNSKEKHSFYALRITPITKRNSLSYGIVTGYNESVIPLLTLDTKIYEKLNIRSTVAPVALDNFSQGIQLILGLQYMIGGEK